MYDHAEKIQKDTNFASMLWSSKQRWESQIKKEKGKRKSMRDKAEGKKGEKRTIIIQPIFMM